MRLTVLALIVLSSSASAHAGSIELVTSGRDTSRSVERIRCDACVIKQEKKEAAAVIELAPGTQKIEIRDVDGERKIYRTEAWMGGSPVVHVSKMLAEIPAETAGDQPVDAVVTPPALTTSEPAQAEADMIDEKSKTSAVTVEAGADARVEIKAQAFDPSKLELRLN